MAMTFQKLTEMLRALKLNFFVDPGKAALVPMSGLNGPYTFLVILDLQGTYLHFRTRDHLICPKDHPNAAVLFRTLLAVNNEARFVKYSWDPNSGQVFVCADFWLMDGTITEAQLRQMLGNFTHCADHYIPRLRAILQTGTDPGARPPQQLVEALLSGGTPIPDELRKFLEKMRADAAKPAPKPPPPPDEKPPIEEL